jgi:hypothetical protein
MEQKKRISIIPFINLLLICAFQFYCLNANPKNEFSFLGLLLGIVTNASSQTSAPSASYLIQVNVTGLVGTGLVLKNNSGDDLTINTNGDFSFATSISEGNAYNVTVHNQPFSPTQTCFVTNGSGIVKNSSVIVSINCSGIATTPLISLVSPSNGSTGIGLNLPISVTFNESMEISTIDTTTSGTACTGSIQLSSDNFVTCIPFATQPIASNGNKTFSIYPSANLATSTIYKIKIAETIKSSNGISLSGSFTQLSGFTTGATIDATPPTAGSTFPGNNTSSAFIDTNLNIFFSEAVNMSTITTNVGADTTCSGSIQVSSDNFISCIPMLTQPIISSEKSIEFRPANPLMGLTNYKFRVTTAVQDIVGNNLAAQYESVNGFTTVAGSAPNISISTTSPANGATNVALAPVKTITFTAPIYYSSVSVNLGNTSCTGTIQISKDDFATCVPFNNPPAISGGMLTLLLTTSAFSASSTYKYRVTTNLKNTAGTPLAIEYTSPIGFTTIP